MTTRTCMNLSIMGILGGTALTHAWLGKTKAEAWTRVLYPRPYRSGHLALNLAVGVLGNMLHSSSISRLAIARNLFRALAVMVS